MNILIISVYMSFWALFTSDSFGYVYYFGTADVDQFRYLSELNNWHYSLIFHLFMSGLK